MRRRTMLAGVATAMSLFAGSASAQQASWPNMAIELSREGVAPTIRFEAGQYLD